MNIKFNKVRDYRSTLTKITNSAEISNVDDALYLGDLSESCEKAFKKLDIIIKASTKEYGVLASERASTLHPQGYNTLDEIDASNEKIEVDLEKVCDVPFKFEPLTDSTFKAMLKDENKKLKLVPFDIKNIKAMGLFPKQEKKDVSKN